MADRPAPHVPAVASAGDGDALIVDPILSGKVVGRRHDILEVAPAPAAEDCRLPPLPVRSAAVWIDEQDAEAFAGEKLHLMEEGPSVRRLRTTMNVDYGRRGDTRPSSGVHEPAAHGLTL